MNRKLHEGLIKSETYRQRNYWLLAPAIGSVALVAAAVLSLTMGWFSWVFPLYAGFNRGARLLVQLSGIGSMVLAILIFTELHDMLINLAGLLGLVMMAGILAGLWKLRWIILFRMGVLNLVLVALNNVLYYEKSWIVGLPLVQKITFLMFLVWVSWISVRIFTWNSKRGKNHANWR